LVVLEGLTKGGSGAAEVASEFAQSGDAKLDGAMNNKNAQPGELASAAARTQHARLDTIWSADVLDELLNGRMAALRHLHWEAGQERIGAQDARVTLVAQDQFAVDVDADARHHESLIRGARAEQLVTQRC
jgi:hypothetical protein